MIGQSKKQKNFDLNNDGVIDANEMAKAGGRDELKKLGFSAYNENGKETITVINSGGNYYVLNNHNLTKLTDTGETMSSYAPE